MGDISQRGLDLIKKWEGFYEHAYDDGEGVWTIGYGTIRWDLKTPVKKGDTITHEEAERQLRKELQRVEDAIDASIKVPLNSCEFSALCSFGYNVGIGWITGKGHQQATFIKKLNAGDRGAVPQGLLQFSHGAVSGKVYQGLLNRRKDEVKLWLSDPHEQPAPAAVAPPAPSSEPMPQAVAPAPVSVTKGAAKSPSIWGAFGAIASTIGAVWQQLVSVAGDTTGEVATARQSLSGFDALWDLLKVNSGVILGGVTLACLAVVVVRKLNAIREAGA